MMYGMKPVPFTEASVFAACKALCLSGRQLEPSVQWEANALK